MTPPLGGAVRRSVLPNGLRVITESVPAMRSVTFGVWVHVGSRDEPEELAGCSHFLEHLLFKGTARRDAWQISAELEAVGGETNAFTTKECTCYYARVLDTDLPLAVDVICDVVTAARLDPADVETERGVICEEIAMTDDDPGDAVHDLFAHAVLGRHRLGRPIAGEIATVSEITREQVTEFYRQHYVPGRMVVAAAGNLDHDQLVDLVSAAFARATGPDGARPDVASRSSMEVTGEGMAATPQAPTPDSNDRVQVRPKDTEQAHVLLGSTGLTRHDERRFALGVLNNALGAGMSSRLFQEVRERRGLAYTVFSHAVQYADTGLFGVYAGCAPGKVDEVLTLVRAEVARVAADGLTDEEVRRGQGMLRGGMVLDLEDTGSRMTRLGKGALLHDDLLSVDELLARVDAVTADDVRSVASELLRRPASLAVIGPFREGDFAAFMEN